MWIEFNIPGLEIVPKQSTRFGKGHAYQTAEIKANAAEIIAAVRPRAPRVPLDEAVEVRLDVTYPYLVKHKRERRTGVYVPKISSPDTEQLSKQVHDCLVKAGFFVNDSRIWRSQVTKEHGPEPGVHVAVETVE